MRLHGLRQLGDDKSVVASCLQTCCKLIVKTRYAKAWRVQFVLRQAATSLILTDLLQLDEIDKFVATMYMQHVCS